jgi:excisionase family DNA binding protein
MDAMRKARRQLLTTEEVAQALSVKPKTVRRWILAGELPAVKLHRQWRVDAVELERLLRRAA